MSWRRAAVVVAAGCVVAAGALYATHATIGLPWAADQPGTAGTRATPPPPPAPGWEVAPAVLDAPAGAAGDPSAPTVADALAASLASDALGGSVGVEVIDLASGATVHESSSDVARTPASTLKILTATAALHVLGPDHVFTTKVVAPGPELAAAPDGTAPAITLVGGGDPMLSGSEPGWTSLDTLAATTAAALTEAGLTTVRLSFDDSLFTGSGVDPDWESDYISGDIVAPISALSLDGGRPEPGSTPQRVDDPPEFAAQRFAALLAGHGITVDGEPARGAVPEAPVDVATIDSAPLSSVVEHVLDTSDNEGAEVLARHAALGSGRAGSEAEAGPAVVEALAALGIDLSGADVLDGSGLARGSAVPASALAGALVLAASPDHPELRAVVTGLPVAGFTGTLDDRFEDEAGAVGLVRAKTGTLTGVSALAGVTTASNGVAYAFVVLADDVSDTTAARAALDGVASAVTQCGCS